MAINLCFTGDCILPRKPENKDLLIQSIEPVFSKADIRIGNLEMAIIDKNCFASTFCGGMWLGGSKERLSDLKDLGFEFLSFANNHSMDYSYNGLLHTLDALNSTGISTAGAGSSLVEANSAKILYKNNLKVSFIACTASCDDAARAGDKNHFLSSRPGVNMLRHDEIYTISEEYMSIVEEIAEATCINSRFYKAVKEGFHELPYNIRRLGRTSFKVGDRMGKYTKCNKKDIDRILHTIENSKKESHIIIVLVHSHDIKGDTDDTPDYYLEEFAHACIDKGAHAVIGTGTHQLKAVEIYKGAPIFYSLGNFIFRINDIDIAPYDYYERFNVPVTEPLQNVQLARTNNGTRGLERDYLNYRSVVPLIKCESDRVTSVELYPIELNFDDEKAKGFPRISDEKVGREIFKQLEGLSTIYGTKLELEQNCIKVLL